VAFTAVQKRDIRKYMGVSFGFYDLNHRLESMMNLVGSDATDQAQIDTWLTELTALEAAIAAGTSASSATYGALRKVDEVEFFSPEESGGSAGTSTSAADRGTVLIQRIARALGVSDYLPIGNYFKATVRSGFMISLG
jgi:hypothetical protein